MRGLRSQLPLGFELRTADEMDVDVAGKKKSHFTKALHAPDDIRDAVEVDAFPFNDDVGAGYTTDAQGKFFQALHTGALHLHSGFGC